jgi:hypothetical protein
MKRQHSNRPRAFVKFYDWRALLKIVIRDMERCSGLKTDPKDQVHYVGGVDTHGHPFLRADLTPLKVRRPR